MRKRAWAALMSLNAMVMAAAREPGPLVTRCRSRTVAEPHGGERGLDRVRGAEVPFVPLGVCTSRIHSRPAEFGLVAFEHRRQERDAMRTAPIPVIVSDTDVLATTIWHERYLGHASPSVVRMAAAGKPDLYVLTGDESPFVQDGLRDGEHLRHAMQQRFRDVLAEQDVPWLEVRGPAAVRLADTVARVERLLRRGWDLAPPLG